MAAAAERERGTDAGGARRRGCNPENSFQTSLLTFDTEQLGFRHMRRYCYTKQCLVKTTRKREKDRKKKLKFHRKP